MATIDLTEARRITEAKEKQYGLPPGTLFKMSGIESSYNANAVSPKGAQGYFQFMPSTAKLYGLDDPTDFEKSADAAGRYMKDNLKRFGNLDLALVQYNGGDKAVKAFAKGTPWRESTDYLDKFYGRKPSATAGSTIVPSTYTPTDTTTSPQFTTAKSEDRFVGASDSELWKKDQQRAEVNDGVVNTIKNFPEAVSLNWQLQDTIWNYTKLKGMESVDPDFAWTKERLDKYLDGVPEQYWSKIVDNAKSDEHAAHLRGWVEEGMKNQQRLAEMGSGVALSSGLVGGLAHWETLLGFVPYLGSAADLATASRVANAIRFGLITAGTNVAAEYAQQDLRPLATNDDLYLSGLIGFALGAGGGAMVNPRTAALAAENSALSRTATRMAIEARKAEFLKNGYDLTPEGRAYFDNALRAVQERNTYTPPDMSLPKAFKFDPDTQYTLRNGILEEVKAAAPEYSLGVKSVPLYGAEENFVNLLFSRGLSKEGTTVDEILSAFKFNSKGEITGTTSKKVSLNDLKELGVRTKEDIEYVVAKYNVDKSYDKLVQFARKESAKDNLGKLAASSDPSIAPLAARLKDQLLTDVPVYRVRQKDIDEGTRTRGKYAGFYSSNRHAVFVPDTASEGTMLHEILHAANVHKIEYGLANPDTIHGKLVGELDALYKMAQKEARKSGFKSYYMKNLKEFTAGLYTGKQAKAFHDFLAGIKVEDATLLSKIVDTIRKMFGFNEQETNALIKALDLTDRLNDERLTVKIDRRGNLATDTIHFHPLEGVEPETAVAASRAGLSEVFGWGLGLENRLGSSKIPEAVRSLAAKLFGTTVGYKDHSVVKANAWDDTTMWSKAWTAEMKKTADAAFMDWKVENKVKWHDTGKAHDIFYRDVSDYIRGFEKDYAPQVVKAGEAIRKTMAKAVDYINNPLFDQGLIKRGLTEVEIQDVKTGLTELVGKLEKNPNYLPRKHDINKWNSMVSTFGRDSVEGWWARAYKSARGDAVTDAQAESFGKWYVRAVEDAHANRSTELFDDLLKGQDRDALKLSLMQHGGFNEQQALDIIEGMFPTKPSDTGRTSASLRHRNSIDERYTETWKLADGTSQEVTINDFINSNAMEVTEGYLRRTAASVALAKHLDVYKMSDIDTLIGNATKNTLGEGFTNTPAMTKMRDDLRFAFDRILGVPQEEFTPLRGVAKMWHDFNVIRSMGASVWNQAIEFSNIVGTMGWKATLQAIPELRALKRDLKSGKVANNLLDELENTIGGVGSEYVERMHFKGSEEWVRNLGDTAFNRRMDAIHTGLKKFASGVLDYTGMTPLMIQQKRLHAVALVNHFVNQANGKIQSKFLNKERLAWMGLSEGDYNRILENLRKYTKPKQGEYSKTFKLDLQKWVAEDPESHSKFMTAIHRESRRVVQENDLASMVPIMGSTLGKTVFQFMNFTIHGWNKSLMFSLNHRDTATMMTMLHGSFLASLSYMGRTMVQASGMDEEKRKAFLEKRMAVGQIVANSFGRLAQASLLPNIYDTLSPYPMFNGMRTTSDLSSLASNPTYQAINSLISTKKLIRNSLSDEYQTTSKDIKAWSKLVPLNNVYPMTTFFNSLANDYPSTEQQND